MANKKRKVVFVAVIIIVIAGIMFFSQSKNNIIRELRGPAAGVLAVYTSGDKLIVISRANEVYAWDWNDLKKWPTVAKLNTEILCPMAGDKIIYVPIGRSDTIVVTDLKGEKQIKKISLPFGVKCKMIAPSDDCSYVALLLIKESKNKLAFVGPDLKLSELFRIEDADEDFEVFQIGISNDGKYIAICGKVAEHAMFHLVNTENETTLGKYVKAGEDSLEQYDRLAFSPDGRKIFVGEKVRFIQMFDAETTTLEKTFEIPAYEVGANLSQNISCISISPDSKKILAVTEPASSIWLWDVQTGSKISHFSAGGGPISDVSFSPEGSMLAVGCLVSSTINIWNLPEDGLE